MTDQPEATAPEGPSLVVNAQYLKDMSFENPRAPHALANMAEPPAVQVNVDVQADRLGDTAYEVTLTINAEASKDGEAVFVVEVVFAGVFTVTGAEDDVLRPILLIEAPRLIFPFARAIVAGATRDGGFPPLLVNPIDFVDLYRRRISAEREAAEREEKGEKPDA